MSVFSVNGDRLALRQVVPSYGEFPVSVAVHDDLVYVLNARAGGSVQGYGIFGGHVFPLGSNRALGLNAAATPEFVNTPGQVAFSPDGSQLIVTTKANGSSIDVFRVGFFGTLSTAGRERRAGHRALRRHVRPARQPRRHRGRNERGRDVRPSPRRNDHACSTRCRQTRPRRAGSSGPTDSSTRRTPAAHRSAEFESGPRRHIDRPRQHRHRPRVRSTPRSARTATTCTCRPAPTASSTSSASTVTARSPRSAASRLPTRSAAKASSPSSPTDVRLRRGPHASQPHPSESEPSGKDGRVSSETAGSLPRW